MSTTIRINERDKDELDKLQAEVFLATGKKLSYPELLGVIMKMSRTSLKGQLIELIRSPQEIDWEKSEKYVSDWGFSDSSDIDEVLYG